MYEQCRFCVKADVCPKVYYHGAFEDKPCEHRLTQVPPNEFQFKIGDTVWYIRNTENGFVSAESKINELKVNQQNRIRYRVEGCGHDLKFGKDVFRTEYEAFKAVEMRKEQ